MNDLMVYYSEHLPNPPHYKLPTLVIDNLLADDNSGVFLDFTKPAVDRIKMSDDFDDYTNTGKCEKNGY